MLEKEEERQLSWMKVGTGATAFMSRTFNGKTVTKVNQTCATSNWGFVRGRSPQGSYRVYRV